MSLSVDLINQFVKATNDKTQEKNETIAYGTVKESNGVKYVQLDGSDLLTPADMTADALDGERVTVLIKNHKATVTGNISQPSASKERVDETISGLKITVNTKMSKDDLSIGGRNLIRNSKNMVFDDYYFNEKSNASLVKSSIENNILRVTTEDPSVITAYIEDDVLVMRWL